MGLGNRSDREQEQRARLASEQLRVGVSPRNSRFGRRGGGQPGPRIPWLLRKRFLFPLVTLLSVLGTAGYLWWTTPVVNTLTGAEEHRGAGVERFVSRLIRPELPLSASFGGRNQISVLLVGLDHVPARRGETVFHRSDSVLLSTADFETRQIRIVSIPRDGWVEQLNPRGEVIHDKLGHSYVHGQERDLEDKLAGILNTRDAVTRLLRLQPDYYVVIQFEGLVKLIDELGGLEVDVEKRMRYTDRAGDLFINFKPGPQHMTGEEVVQYARFRHDVMGDIGRMERQQKVIKLVIEEIKKPQNLAKAPQLISILHQAVLTNFSFEQLAAFASKLDEYQSEGIKTMTLQSYGNHEPGYENMAPGAGRMSVQVMTEADIEAARSFLQDLSAPPPPAVEEAGEETDDSAAQGATADAGQGAAGSSGN